MKLGTRNGRTPTIKLSKQHGLNPTMNVCFFCGQNKNLIILGKLKNDAKAPNKILADYQPCKTCAEKIARGRLVLEVTTQDPGTVPIAPGAWPTGRWCVISRKAADVLFKGNTNAQLLTQDLYEALLVRTRKFQV